MRGAGLLARDYRRPANLVASAAAVGLWYLLLAPTSLGGPLGLVWVTGASMEPTLSTGDVSILYEHQHYEVGDVVAFEIPEGGVVIHRITEVLPGGYRFQGDNRNERDPWLLDEEAVIGRQLLVVPSVGQAMTVTAQPAVMASLVALLVALIGLRRAVGRRSTLAPAPVHGD